MKKTLGLLGILFLWVIAWTPYASAQNLAGVDIHGYLS